MLRLLVSLLLFVFVPAARQLALYRRSGGKIVEGPTMLPASRRAVEAAIAKSAAPHHELRLYGHRLAFTRIGAVPDHDFRGDFWRFDRLDGFTPCLEGRPEADA